MKFFYLILIGAVLILAQMYSAAEKHTKALHIDHYCDSPASCESVFQRLKEAPIAEPMDLYTEAEQEALDNLLGAR